MILNSRTYLNSCHRRLPRNYIKKRLRKNIEKEKRDLGPFPRNTSQFKMVVGGQFLLVRPLTPDQPCKVRDNLTERERRALKRPLAPNGRI